MNGVLMGHQAGDEVNVTGQAVELRDDNRGLELPGGGQGGGELRPAIERVGALARLDLAEGLGQGVAFGLGKAGERGLLRFEAEAGASLAGGRNAGVGDGGFHGLGLLRHRATLVGGHKALS